jgi:hypothetical protein
MFGAACRLEGPERVGYVTRCRRGTAESVGAVRFDARCRPQIADSTSAQAGSDAQRRHTDSGSLTDLDRARDGETGAA